MTSRQKPKPTLRTLLAKRPGSLTAMATIDRYEAAPPPYNDDRGMVLVCVALVEQLLEDAILTQCLAKFEEPAYRDRLFSGAPDQGGVAGTFSAKITLGYALGLYGKQMREDLDALRRIRNAFAHARVPITLNTKEVRASLAVNLYKAFGSKTWGWGTTRPRIPASRARFLTLVAFIMIMLYGLRVRNVRYRPRMKARNTGFVYAHSEHLPNATQPKRSKTSKASISAT